MLTIQANNTLLPKSIKRTRRRPANLMTVDATGRRNKKMGLVKGDFSICTILFL